jgi:hypothetical protein
LSTDAGADGEEVIVGVGSGVGVRSIFRRFGSAFSDSSSSLSCLRTDDLAGEDDDAGEDDESGPGPGADATVGVGVRGQGSVVVAGAGAGVGQDDDEGVSSSTTIGGGVCAEDDFLVQVAAPHVHLSMIYHAEQSARVPQGERRGRTCVISASLRSRCTRTLRSA